MMQRTYGVAVVAFLAVLGASAVGWLPAPTGLASLLLGGAMLGAQLTGPISLAAGKGPARFRILGTAPYDTLDDALGSATSVYLIPDGADPAAIGKPATQGSAVPISSGPHVLEGENLYVVIKANESGKTFDTDDANNAFYIQVHQYNADGSHDDIQFTSYTQRNSTTTTGGLADDRPVTQYIETAVIAFGPVPPGSAWTVYGQWRTKLDDTA